MGYIILTSIGRGHPPSVPIVGVGDMSLQKDVPGQNFTFALINLATDAALTGATITAFTSRDGGAQASTTGTFSEPGNGMYNYAPTQAETNGNCVSFLITATSAIPENLMFLTKGLIKNVPGQHVTFLMMSTAGVADASASVSVFVTKDGGAQLSGGGAVTNLGHGQYDYAPTQTETNGINVSFLFTSAGDIPQNLSVFTVP
jgi:hypothetical protein